MVYSWKTGGQIKANAVAVGKELNRIRGDKMWGSQTSFQFSESQIVVIILYL